MAKSTVYQKGQRGEGVSFNMTPMIDVTFQLIIFFILAGQMASQELAQLKLWQPDNSQAVPDEKLKVQRVVVNIVSAVEGKEDQQTNAIMAAQAKEYRIGPLKIAAGNTELLTNELKTRRDKSNADEFFVEIRSDYRVHFSQVRPVMMAAAAANIPKMNITALLATGE